MIKAEQKASQTVVKSGTSTVSTSAVTSADGSDGKTAVLWGENSVFLLVELKVGTSAAYLGAMMVAK